LFVVLLPTLVNKDVYIRTNEPDCKAPDMRRSIGL